MHILSDHHADHKISIVQKYTLVTYLVSALTSAGSSKLLHQ